MRRPPSRRIGSRRPAAPAPGHVEENAIEVVRRDPVQRLADMVVDGQALDAEQSADAGPALARLQLFLGRQEGGALEKKRRKTGHSDVGHRDAGVTSGSGVRGRGTERAHFRDLYGERRHGRHCRTPGIRVAGIPMPNGLEPERHLPASGADPAASAPPPAGLFRIGGFGPKRRRDRERNPACHQKGF